MQKTKTQRYSELVAQFKTYEFSDKEQLLNPHQIFKEFDLEYDVINPWEIWHNNLDAEIMFIGQDFSDTASLRKNLKENWEKEKDLDTNQTILEFFKRLGPPFSLHEVNYTVKSKQRLFFTNAILGIKQSKLDKDNKEKEGMANSVKDRWYLETLPYLKELIGIIEPKYIIAMGKKAYKAICKIYNIIPKETMFEAIGKPIELSDDRILFVVQHCSGLGCSTRARNIQYSDWMEIRNIINPA